jgi:hypothetical protein
MNSLGQYYSDAIFCHFGDCRLTEINSREYLEDFEEKLHHQPLQGVDSGDVVLA